MIKPEIQQSTGFVCSGNEQCLSEVQKLIDANFLSIVHSGSYLNLNIEQRNLALDCLLHMLDNDLDSFWENNIHKLSSSCASVLFCLANPNISSSYLKQELSGQYPSENEQAFLQLVSKFTKEALKKWIAECRAHNQLILNTEANRHISPDGNGPFKP